MSAITIAPSPLIRKSLGIEPLSHRLSTKASTQFVVIMIAFVTLFFIWGATFSVDKVTRGNGRVLPSVQNQIVQHLEGGMVEAVLVKEGAYVHKGDILLKIRNQFTNAESNNAQTDVTARQLAMLRFEAETRGDKTLQFPPALVMKAPEIAGSERALFTSRRNQVMQELSVIDDQISRYKAELSGLAERLINLRQEELLSVKQLRNLEKGLAAEATSEHDVLEKRTSLQQLRTRIADVANQIPQTRSELSEAESRHRETWAKFVSEGKEKIAQMRLEMSKASESLGAYRDRESREALRAPMDGIINKVYMQTVGGVVRGGEPLVEIVPVDHSVIIEAKINPSDRGQVWPGLPATIKISAYEYSVYGGLKGKVIDISPDALQEPDGKTFYRVRLEANTGFFGKDKPVVPGMTAEVDIKSGSQTILNYISKPISSMRDNAFKER